MDFGLSEDQREIQRTARELLNDRARWERVREHAENRRSDEALWKELCELGWPGIAVAEEYGGQGLGAVALSVLCEELGRVVAPVPFLPTVLAATLIEHAGEPEQHERWLPGLASGELLGALGVARDGVAELVVGGAQAGAAQGGAVQGGAVQGGAAQGGAAQGGAAQAGVIVLLEGDSARVLEAAEADIEPIEAIDPTRSAARISTDLGVGEALTGDVAGAVDRALIAVASELVGVSERALEMTLEYVKERRQFGVPVGSYQAVSHRCAQMLLDTEKARSLSAFAAWTADADPLKLAEAAAMAKAAASDAGREVTAGAIQAHGGIGFTWEADVHWLYKRAQIDAAWLGGAKYHRARVAAMLGELSAAVPT
jgi:alkylation response protein AidB-like acyl-CoA dehydrogenase